MTITHTKHVARRSSAGAALDGARLLSDLTSLSSTRFAGRRIGTAGHDLARDWLFAQLGNAGLRPAISEFTPGAPVLDLYAQPRLTIIAGAAGADIALVHRVEFAEHPRSADAPRPLRGNTQRLADVVNTPGSWALLEALPRGEELDALAARAAAASVVGLLAPQYPGVEGFLTKRVIAQPAIGLPLLAVRADLLPDLEGKLVEATVALRRASPSGANVLARLDGTDPARSTNPIVVSAHYDGVGDDPGGHRIPAASDNAAAVAIMLGLVRLLASRTARLRRPIIFAALDAEEIGAFGSQAHAQMLRESGQAPHVINIDGAGRLGEAFWVDPGAAAGELLAALELAGQELELPLIVGGVASDNRRYAGAGFPAVGISSGGHGYHTPADTPERVQVAAMIAVGKLVLQTIMHLAT